MPVAPRFSTWPERLNPPNMNVMLKVTLRALKGTSTTGVSEPLPKTRSVAVRLLAGAVLSAQFAPVLKLSFAPPPSQVSTTAKARAVRRRAMVVVRRRGVFMGVES